MVPARLPGRRIRGDDAACPSRPGRTACRCSDRGPVRPPADTRRDVVRVRRGRPGPRRARSSTCRIRGAPWRTRCGSGPSGPCRAKLTGQTGAGRL